VSTKPYDAEAARQRCPDYLRCSHIDAGDFATKPNSGEHPTTTDGGDHGRE
jgi:hypothetical protein